MTPDQTRELKSLSVIIALASLKEAIKRQGSSPSFFSAKDMLKAAKLMAKEFEVSAKAVMKFYKHL